MFCVGYAYCGGASIRYFYMFYNEKTKRFPGALIKCSIICEYENKEVILCQETESNVYRI